METKKLNGSNDEDLREAGGIIADGGLVAFPTETVFGLGAQVGVMLPFSRKHESEADYMGLALMTMAGYDPGAAVGFWKKMAAKGGSSSPAILSSHPSDATRIANIQKALPEIRATYGAKK